IATPEGPRAAMSNGRSYAPFVLEGIETMFAMTIHKSQGSQFDRVTVVLPGADSPLLTRELLYTAITRARRGVRIIGLREAIVTAVRTPARRASGLTDRLQRTSVRPH
ncbi:MAG: ATP-binding domain-containing protein, partial [Propionibacterium sp.]|nr:ATP-binding domain-containing protein [Propionibacterium sp.]